MKRAGLHLALLLALPGCGVLQALRDPGGSTAQVASVQVTLEGAAGGTALLELTVPDGGEVPLELRALQWELWLRGRHFASGLVTRAELVRFGEQARLRVRAPFVLPPGSAPAFGLAQVALQGNLTLARGDDERTFAFQHGGFVVVAPAERTPRSAP